VLMKSNTYKNVTLSFPAADLSMGVSHGC
jgi:hypothetical protein